MKRFILLSLSAVMLLSCSKSKNNPTPTNKPLSVEYDFTSSVSDTYSVQYPDSNGNLTTTSFTGTTWKKVVTMNATGALALTYIMQSQDAITANTSGKILVNGVEEQTLSKSYTSSHVNFEMGYTWLN